jgi:hypothetical protein
MGGDLAAESDTRRRIRRRRRRHSGRTPPTVSKCQFPRELTDATAARAAGGPLFENLTRPASRDSQSRRGLIGGIFAERGSDRAFDDCSDIH